MTKECHRARVALDTLYPIPSKSPSPYQSLQSPTWSDPLSLTFSSPGTLPLAHRTRPTSPLLFFQYTKSVPSLWFLYCLFPSLGHSTCSYPLINCLTSFKTLLKCHFLIKTYPDHPIKNCNSHPYAHTFLIPVIMPYFCPGQFLNSLWMLNKWMEVEGTWRLGSEWHQNYRANQVL